jgi:lipoprotein-anchoring transpeptidase ErfK/SrfK
MKPLTIVIPLVLIAAACSPPAQQQQSSQATVQMSEQARLTMDRVNSARLAAPMPEQMPERVLPSEPGIEAAPPPAGENPTAATPATEVDYDAGLVRMQVLLDRAHFSPGVVDGYDGENVRKAVSAYQAAHDLPVTGRADDAFLTRLEQADSSPALVAYVVTTEDVAGPFVDVPEGLLAMSELQRVGYESAEEALAEKFHMDEDLLRTLNPGVDFTQAGAEIVVANAGSDLTEAVASIEIDTREQAVRAFNEAGELLAFYPATIGSTEAPSPDGEHTVRGIAFDPTYRYDPARLPTFGDRGHGAVNIAGGPNNPVGAVWIALSADTYGIHGAPEPQRVSKTASHGCVRMTNWDAVELGRAVTAGTPVRFVAGTGLAQRETTTPG